MDNTKLRGWPVPPPQRKLGNLDYFPDAFEVLEARVTIQERQKVDRAIRQENQDLREKRISAFCSSLAA